MGNRTVVIGASMNGIEALRQLVGALPANFPAPILVAQHVGRSSRGFLPAILTRSGALPATHPDEERGERVTPGRIYVAPPDRHMLLEGGFARLSHGPRENFTRPSIDPLFRSAALDCGPSAIGVVLTGHLHDGTAGLLAIKDMGGTAIVQDPEEAPAPSMPRSALQKVRVDHCLPLVQIAQVLVELANDAPSGKPAVPDRRLLEIEHGIAFGRFSPDEWSAFEQRAIASGLNCPLCRSALYQVRDDRLLRFRCRSGHAASAFSLLAAQAQAHESQLSTLLGLLCEEAALARSLLEHAGNGEGSAFAEGMRRRVDLLTGEAAQLAQWLHARARWAG